MGRAASSEEQAGSCRPAGRSASGQAGVTGPSPASSAKWRPESLRPSRGGVFKHFPQIPYEAKARAAVQPDLAGGYESGAGQYGS
ncbi:hypothetical protein GCM10018966_031060 [Streptomyces yanii]